MTFFERRILLKRAMQASACVVGMPLLECVLNGNGTAYANGTPLERFYGTFFMGNGKARDTWIPLNSNGNADPGWGCADDDPLRPIIESGCKPDISVITGLNAPSLRNGPHKHSQSLTLSGGVGTRDGEKSYADTTIDQLVAEYSNTEPLVASCCRKVSSNANNLERFISWKRTNVPNNPVLDPKQLFDSIFLAVDTSGRSPKFSILDQVLADIQILKNQGISVADQQRLDEHAAAIRSLEQQLEASGQEQSQTQIGLLSNDIDALYPNNLGISYSNAGVISLSNSEAQINARWDLLTRITALALNSRKRVGFALAFTHPGDQTPLPGQVFYPNRGVHSLAHTGNSNAQSDLNQVTRFQVQKFCQLVNTLKNQQDITGQRLLDRGLVLCTSELDYGYGANHVHNNIPMLLAGSASGRFQTGVHLDASGKQVGDAGLTALKAVLGESADFPTPANTVAKPNAPFSELLNI